MGINLDEVKLQDYYPFDKNFCSYKIEGYKLSCKENDLITKKSISFPFPVGFVDASFVSDNAIEGDYVNCWVERTIDIELHGTIGSNVWLPKNEWGGFVGSRICIEGNDVYTIIGIDSYGNYILNREFTIEYNGIYAVTMQCPIYSFFYIMPGFLYETHKKTFGCKYIPIGYTLEIEYYHKNQLVTDKSMFFLLGYIYGNLQ